MTPSPVIEALVTKQEDGGRRLQVALREPARARELGVATKIDGEQAFLGMLWLDDKPGPASLHVYYDRISPVQGAAGLAWLECSKALPEQVLEKLTLGTTALSLPVPGIALRHGPGAMVVIDHCENVNFEQVDVWAAPWFAFEIFRNTGDVNFRKVNIRPQPGAGRRTSSWRDGFHVKGNSARRDCSRLCALGSIDF